MGRCGDLFSTPEIRALLSKRNYPARIWESYLLANWNQGMGKEERNAWVLGQLQLEEKLITSHEHYTPESHSRIAMHLGDTGVLFGRGSLTVDVPSIGEKDIERLCVKISERVAEAWRKQRDKPIELFAVLSAVDNFELERYYCALLCPFSKTLGEAIADPSYRHKMIGYLECRDEHESPSWWFPSRGSKGIRLLFEHKPQNTPA